MFNFKLILSFYVIALFFYYLWWDLTYWILCLLCAFWQMSPQLRIRTLDALNFTFQLICSLTRNCIISTLSTYSSLPQQSKDIQGAFFNCSSQFSVPKWKTMGSQSEILFHEILDVQKILVGWTTFFFLALKFGRNSWKTTLYDIQGCKNYEMFCQCVQAENHFVTFHQKTF